MTGVVSRGRRRRMRNWVVALMACCIAASLPGPVDAQSGGDENDFLVFDEQTPLGPLRVAVRVRDASERSAVDRPTHEVLFAHPVWGYGYYRENLEWSCRSRGPLGTNSTVWRWDGTEGSRRGLVLEGLLDHPVQGLIGTERYNSLISSVICDRFLRGDFRPRDRTVAALRQAAGRLVDPWPKHKVVLSQGTVMRVAAPFLDAEGQPATREFSQRFDTRYSGERSLGAEGVTLTGVTITEPSRALDLVSASIRSEGATVVSRDRLANHSSYALDQMIVRDESGQLMVARALACTNRPDLVYSAWAEYDGVEEQVFALRFVGSLRVNCGNPAR